ncbi:hypothetical protein ACISOT_01135, partial [Campylobacter jejuni]
MNNFKEIAKLVRKYKERNNALYEFLDKEDVGEYFRSLISLSELKQDKTTMLAILRRLIDLKEENLVQEWKKNNFKEDKIIELKHKFYEEVRKFYEKEHQNLINEIKEKKLLNNFYQSLIPVSYIPLRATQTSQGLVCRLLFSKEHTDSTCTLSPYVSSPPILLPSPSSQTVYAQHRTIHPHNSTTVSSR